MVTLVMVVLALLLGMVSLAQDPPPIEFNPLCDMLRAGGQGGQTDILTKAFYYQNGELLTIRVEAEPGVVIEVTASPEEHSVKDASGNILADGNSPGFEITEQYWQITFVFTGDPTTLAVHTQVTDANGQQGETAACNTHPTAVTLASFTAVVDKKIVLLRWETVSEADNLGFYLYRASTLTSTPNRVNVDLIPSWFPGSLMGGKYEFRDYAPYQGKSYYWLESVSNYGENFVFGPIEVSNNWVTILLPFVNR